MRQLPPPLPPSAPPAWLARLEALEEEVRQLKLQNECGLTTRVREGGQACEVSTRNGDGEAHDKITILGSASGEVIARAGATEITVRALEAADGGDS